MPKIWRLRSKEFKKRHRDHTKAQDKNFLDSLKSKPCMDCGNSFPPCAMDFDHRPGEVKRFNLSRGAGRGIKALAREASKCDVVCAVHHRIRTHKRLEEGIPKC